MNPVVVAAIVVLVISVFSNVALGLGYRSAREEMAKTEIRLQQAKDAAELCSKAVERLMTLAVQRKAEADKERAEAKAAAKLKDQKADTIMSQPAKYPGEDCKSAQARASEWLAGRKK
jgi:uncharacterized membrane protein YhiD involved in acid resistance